MLPLDVMRSLAGTQWSSGKAPPEIAAWAETIAKAYPDRASYARQVNQSYLAWCGDTVAYCVTRCGIRPPDEFLLAMGWANWGVDAKSSPQQGDVAVFAWSSGGHHVTIIDEVMSGSQFRCFGGNQSHQVNDEPMPRSSCVAVRRPPLATGMIVSLPAPEPTPAHASNANVCIELVLVSEGGNDDDPRDPGGRTSRGIIQHPEWDDWRQSHPGLPSDVWQAPQDQIVMIYEKKYWDVLCCDQLPPGVDYAVFDFGVNSGNVRSAQFLQWIVGTDVDGEIGPNTVKAASAADARATINSICDQRLAFLQKLGTWSTFGHGWSARVSRVRTDSLNMVGKGKAPPDVPAPPRPPGNPPPPKVPKTPGVLDRLFGGDVGKGLNELFGERK